MSLRVAVFDHQGKSRGLIAALLAEGHEIVSALPVDVLLVDCDYAATRRALIDIAHPAGATILVYQHGAHTDVAAILQHGRDSRVTGVLVHSEGLADANRMMGDPAPQHVIGWSYSDLLPFSPPAVIRRVLFAPRHPFGDGTIADIDLALNRDVADRLAALDVHVTVQSYLSPARNGFPLRPGWEHVPSDLSLSWQQIDRADAVISHSTPAYLAVARGKPTVMLGQDEPFRTDAGDPIEGAAPVQADHRYPLDTADAPLADLLEAARVGGPDIDSWKTRFVGEPMDSAALAATVERLHRKGRP